MAFDISLVVLVLGVAAWTIAARATFAAVIGFVAYGLLLALVWVRLAAPDVAMTEAAIGSGVTGVLLLGASTRLRPAASPAPGEKPGIALQLAAALLCVLVTAGLAAIVLLLPEPALTLAPAAAANIAATGLGNPVTAVLMAYRAIDTLLETVVLALALVGIWSLAPDGVWGGFPGQRHHADSDGVLTFLAQMLMPVGTLVGVHIFWIGSVAPGGEFQGATILAAMWISRDNGGAGGRTRGEPALVAAPAGDRTGDVPRDRAGRLRDGGCFPGLSGSSCQAADPDDRSSGNAFDCRNARSTGSRATGPGAAMSGATLYGLCAAMLVGVGLFGLIVHPQPLRKILAFNLIGSGVFLLLGVAARRGAAAGFGGDPVPQALVITGIVVAFAATALAVTLVLRLFQQIGQATLASDE